MRTPKLLIVSQAFPPEVSGSATLLTNIVEAFKGECTAISGYSRYVKRDPSLVPPCPTISIRPPRIRLFELLYARTINRFRFIVRSAIRKQVRRDRPDVIMGAFPHSTFFIAAFEVAQEFGIPFFAHMHDLWQENYPDGYYAKTLADKYERHILTTAARVLCMTSTQQLHYKNKYGVESDLLPHSIPPGKIAAAEKHLSERSLPKTTILFAGAVSSVMNDDALKVISNSLTQLGIEYDLLFCTNAKREELAAKGYDMSHLHLKWVSKDELEVLLSSADILLAPLSFKNGSDDEVRTVFSTKLLEYLVAGKPILVYGPHDCFHSTSARENGWAFTVEDENPQTLTDTVRHILENREACERVVQNAFREAESRNAEIVAAQLSDLIVRYRKE
jgi:glycosyltransferase involved in cell wall biosynthesis